MNVTKQEKECGLSTPAGTAGMWLPSLLVPSVLVHGWNLFEMRMFSSCFCALFSTRSSIIFLSHEKTCRYTLGNTSVFHGMISLVYLTSLLKLYIWACVCPDIFVELRGQLLGSTMWALGVELRLLGMAASAFILWTISPACNQSFLLDFKIISMFSSL